MKNFYTRVRFEATCTQQVIADTQDNAALVAVESIRRRSFTDDVYVLWTLVSETPLPEETIVRLKARE